MYSLQNENKYNKLEGILLKVSVIKQIVKEDLSKIYKEPHCNATDPVASIDFSRVLKYVMVIMVALFIYLHLSLDLGKH